MKKIIEDPKKCLTATISLILMSEILLKSENMVIQFFGICLLPFIIGFGLLLMMNDKKSAQ